MTSDDERREQIRQILVDLLVDLVPYMTVAALHALARVLLDRLGLI